MPTAQSSEQPALRLILADQLTLSLPAIKNASRQDLFVMAEVMEEAQYVQHHPKKIALLFSAMRHFAQTLSEKGFSVQYFKLDGKDAPQSLEEAIKRSLAKRGFQKVVTTFPGEWRVLKMMEKWQKELPCPVEICPDDRFYVTPSDFKDWENTQKGLLMANFYRWLRIENNIFITKDKKPVGGKWSFDADNRKPFKADIKVPSPRTFQCDDITESVLDLVEEKFNHHFGQLRPFNYAVTREQALKVLNQFIDQRLPCFGDYQDAMWQDDPWLFHSHLSFYINCGLLLPQECIDKAIQAYQDKKAPINAVEGFVRQIVGWREFIRGVYWQNMPGYTEQNKLKASRPLPGWYWGKACQLNCLKSCVQDTKAHAYAHHIQRLMVLGNFALLTGINPSEVQKWFLEVYADAYEWVESPNVQGMALYADGGVFASKPYAAGGAYINKMSNYCKSCHYDVKEKTGPKACPFNYLYWDFLARHREEFSDNQRLAMIYRTWDKMDASKQEATRQSAAIFLKQLD